MLTNTILEHEVLASLGLDQIRGAALQILIRDTETRLGLVKATVQDGWGHPEERRQPLSPQPAWWILGVRAGAAQ